MPWPETDPMLERTKFIAAYESGLYTMTELADRFGVSRKTAYKWRDRFLEGGLAGLKDASRAPHSCPHKTDEAVARLIVAARERHPRWGARPLLALLAREHPRLALPSHGAAHEILRKAGLVKAKRARRRKPTHPQARPLVAEAPNAVWTADFKGEFLLKNRVYCYPLTVQDAFSRFLLECQALDSTEGWATQRAFERLFAEYGLPEAMRTDNGVPFAASTALHGLSTLAVYFVKLGIRLDRIDRGKPQQNGRHERMHRTLKAETTRPPEETLTAQQVRFDAFRNEYNHIRPHQALDLTVPAARYASSSRPFPVTLPEPEYPSHAELRSVSLSGSIKFKSRVYFLSSTLSLELVALEEIDDGIWNVYFYDLLLGRIDQHKQTFIP
jgi:putative transposase